jgi:hypothetical protein
MMEGFCFVISIAGLKGSYSGNNDYFKLYCIENRRKMFLH